MCECGLHIVAVHMFIKVYCLSLCRGPGAVWDLQYAYPSSATDAPTCWLLSAGSAHKDAKLEH